MNSPRKKQRSNSYRQHMAGRVVNLNTVRAHKKMDERRRTLKLQRPRLIVTTIYCLTVLCLVISGGFAVLGFFPIHQQVLFIFLSVIISILGFVLLLVLSVLRKAVHRLFTFQSIILLGAFVCSIVFFHF